MFVLEVASRIASIFIPFFHCIPMMYTSQMIKYVNSSAETEGGIEKNGAAIITLSCAVL
jgi:hypothetical protein